MSIVIKLVFAILKHNISKAQHIPSKVNCIADAVSRWDLPRFQFLRPDAERFDQ